MTATTSGRQVLLSTICGDSGSRDVSLCASCREGGLLVVYQSQWQRRLLARYGSMCLLDATYKTTRYSLPLFFLCTVRTDVDYAVAAVFVAESENSAIISEALELISVIEFQISLISGQLEVSIIELQTSVIDI